MLRLGLVAQCVSGMPEMTFHSMRILICQSFLSTATFVVATCISKFFFISFCVSFGLPSSSYILQQGVRQRSLLKPPKHCCQDLMVHYSDCLIYLDWILELGSLCDAGQDKMDGEA